MIRAITREVHYTLSYSSIDIEDTVRTCLGGVGDQFVFVFIFVFYALVCLFLCLFMCVMFRVSLVFMSASSVVSIFLFIYVFLFTKGSLFLFGPGFRVVLGSCVSDTMTSNQGSLLTYSNLLKKKHSINQERIHRLLDARELHVG